MGFGFSTEQTDNEFLPLFNFNAKKARFETSERVEDGGQWVKKDAVIQLEQVVFAADFATIQQGWLLIKKGVAPIKAFVPLGQPLPPRPAGYGERDEKGREILPKNAFMMRVMLSDGVLREFGGNSLAILAAVGEMLTAYEAAPEAKEGKVPVLKATKLIPSDKNGNERPVFVIDRWVARPEKFGPAPTTSTTAAAPQPAPAQVVNQMPPPAAAPAAPAMHEPAPFAPEVR